MLEPPRLVHNMPDAEYRSASGVNQSSLHPMALSPAHYKHALENQDRKVTPEMALGLLAEDMIFYPDKNDRTQFAFAPEDLDLRRKADREWAAEQEKAGKTIIKKDIRDRAEGVFKAAYADEHSRKLLETCADRQVAWFADYSTVPTKGLVDMDPGPAYSFLCDLKVVSPGFALPSKWQRLVGERNYDVQAAFYLDGYNKAAGTDKTAFIQLVIESEPPHVVTRFQFSPELIGIGRMKYTSWMATLIDCQRRGVWPGYNTSEKFITVQPTSWEARQWLA